MTTDESDEQLYRVVLRAHPVPAGQGPEGAKYIEDDIHEHYPWLKNASCRYDAESKSLTLIAECIDSSGEYLSMDFANFIIGAFREFGEYDIDIDSVTKVK